MRRTLAALSLLLLLASLTGCGSQDAKDGGLGDTLYTCFFEYTVDSAALRQTYESIVPAPGSALLAARVTVRNTTENPIPMSDLDFRAEWEGGSAWPIGNERSPEQLPIQYELAVGEERTGLLVYEVPADRTDFALTTVELFDDGTKDGEAGNTFTVRFTVE